VPEPAWVALSLTGRIGSKTLRSLLAHFGDTNAILEADGKALRQVPGVGPKIARSIQAIQLEQVARDMERWQRAGVAIVTIPDTAYPNRLKGLDDAPPTLFLRREWELLNNPSPQRPPRQQAGEEELRTDVSWPFDKAVAIVGTRRPTKEGMGVARRLASILAQQGYTIVSGLAAGIDTNAHLGALACGGSTVAVLGCGVLNIYPEANIRLSDKILQCGALLCEVNPDATPNAASLVARNRLISGLSAAVIVVETSVDGGAMHAARFANMQGRQVYAVDNGASGNRALIENGATAVPPDWDGAGL
jgi:DNA processing protein